MNDRNQSDDNVISIAEWKAHQNAKRWRKVWVHLPVPDPKQPNGYRIELVQAIPLEPKY